MRERFGRALRAGTAATLLAALAASHVRLIGTSPSMELHWDDPSGIDIVISSAGSADIGDGSHETAIRSAIDAWNEVSGTSARLDEDTSPSQQARTDWEDLSLHLVVFDETNSSGLFPGGSGIVAVTPVSYFLSDGRIADADVLFNGSQFQFTTSGEASRFDVQDVASHELGHLLGLDHSGWAGATMFPYVDPTIILHRSLSEDDANGLQHAYPSGAHSRIIGTVRRLADSSAVQGAHVVARDADGRTHAARITDGDGFFRLQGVEPGTYSVYATPLEGPVKSANLASGHVIQTDFASTLLGSASVGVDDVFDMGDVLVDADVDVLLGASSDALPLRAVAGAPASMHALFGSGLVAGSTLEAADPDVVVVATSWTGSRVTFTVQVPQGEPAGHVDLAVTTPLGGRSILPAAIEVTPPDPVVTQVSPSSGDTGGGTLLTLTGEHFEAGARVVLGGLIYEDGEPGGCVVQSADTITLQTGATPAGVHDVVVISPSGVEGRLVDGFLTASQPVLESVFPASGSSSGATSVLLRGGGFVDGLTVEIEGVLQPGVEVLDASRVRFTTLGGTPGGPYTLTVQNPAGLSASLSFHYAAKADPVFAAVTPDSGTTGGEDLVTVSGSNFTAATRVVFGADPETGAGGVEGDVGFVDSGTLVVVTPALSAGARSVMVREADTAQADLEPAAFAYVAPETPDSGGGGCASVRPGAPPTVRGLASGAAWMILAAALLCLRARRAAAAQLL